MLCAYLLAVTLTLRRNDRNYLLSGELGVLVAKTCQGPTPATIGNRVLGRQSLPGEITVSGLCPL